MTTPPEAPPLTALLRVYRSGLVFGEPAVAGLLAWRARRGKEDPGRLSERRGLPGRARPPGPLVWMHGASVGEILSLVGLVDGMIARGFSVLVTTGTRSAADLIGPRLPPGALHQYVPLDAPRWVARFLDHWRPDLALVAESEIWPSTIVGLHTRAIPLLLVNGRISERSFRGWSRTPRTARALLSRISVCLAQTEADAARFARLGAPRVSVAGNLKYDSEVPPVDAQEHAHLRDCIGDRPVWVAASTHPGEDAVVAGVHAALKRRWPSLLTIVVPRHPHRGGDVAARAAAEGLRSARRSQGERPHGEIALYVADTLGELGLFYRLATVVYLGGSLVERGGQNPIEPTRLGAAVLHGPHIFNFSQVYGALDAAGGARCVADGADLAVALDELLADPARIDAMARAGAAALAPFEGAVDRTLAVLDPFIAQMQLAELASAAP
ncbi:3-deoxy-D-manno-octulosonic acid transferase [Methylobacterium gossipiicola]|uniref:3-deoxy-D-manno-octulosonic acid transferase n=1 Tax=Methylobacterium gossipiicola TaxID=582675 RepID=A0A1I2UE90_9HYPH|nr:3-deoxy-D-manno-octulosonic acid transferase [Methylobacterium gossipiicola]SFG75323.1 3-deoxy-D-manno-octulosonic-acid transferase [Methylobacterium gossipiicola]